MGKLDGLGGRVGEGCPMSYPGFFVATSWPLVRLCQ